MTGVGHMAISLHVPIKRPLSSSRGSRSVTRLKATTEDIRKYSFCPKFFEQGGEFSERHQGGVEFTRLLTYLFRRDLELDVKQNFDSLTSRWKKIFFQAHSEDSLDDLRLYNQSLVALHRFHKWYLKQPTSAVGINHDLSSLVYGHELSSNVPVLLMEPDKSVTLILTEPLVDASLVRLDPAIRYVSMALGEEFQIKKVCNVALIDYKLFHAEEFEPDNRYWESAMLDYVGVMQSLQHSITYPNTSGCNTCSIRMTCEVMKGND
jgi:hypothetical protein